MLTTLFSHLLLYAGRFVLRATRAVGAGRHGTSVPTNECGPCLQNGLVLGDELPLETVLVGMPTVPADAPQLTDADVDLGRHVAITGTSGGGKTNTVCLLLDANLGANRAHRVRPNTVVFDVRGTMANAVLSRYGAATKDQSLEDAASNLLWLDLGDSAFVASHNPLEQGGKPLPQDAAYRAALFLVSLLKKNADSWGVQLEETLTMCLLALALSKNGSYSLLDSSFLLDDPAFRAHVLSGVDDGFVQTWFARYDALSDAKRDALQQPVKNKCSPFLGTPLARCLNGSRTGSFDFGDFLNHPAGGRTVYVSLAAGSLAGAATLMGEMLLDSLLQNAVFSRAAQAEALRVPTVLFVDELQSFMPEGFLEALYEARKFKLGMVVSHQNLQQLSTELKHAVRNNAKTLLIHQSGALDAPELSREIVTGGILSSEQTREALLNFPVGRCFWTERGRSARLVQLRHSPDPVVEPARLTALKRASQQRYCRSRGEVEAEIEARFAGGSCPAGPPRSAFAVNNIEARPLPTPPFSAKGKKNAHH